MKRFFLRSTYLGSLFVILFGLSGCLEEYLATLTPEQRAVFYEVMNIEPPQEGIAASPLASEPETERPLPFALSRLIDEDQCSELISGAPRGLACIHCTQPEAFQQAKLLANLMFRSCVKNIATNFLVDGTFSYDEEFLLDLITLLSSGGRKLFVTFYLSNGATQRRWANTPINSFATKMAPETFRKKIHSDTVLQQKYQSIATRLIPVLNHAAKRGAAISIVPTLEDNLDDKAFTKLAELSLAALPNNFTVSLGRNPCPGCYAGNSTYTPDGIFKEVHTASSSISVKDGLVTNDGIAYSFQAQAGQLGLNDLTAVRDAAEKGNNAFILWSNGFQGLTNNSSVLVHPSKRNYEIPSIDERKALIDFLRGE